MRRTEVCVAAGHRSRAEVLLWNHRSTGTGARVLIHIAVDDPHAGQDFVYQTFTDNFDVLLGVLPGPLAPMPGWQGPPDTGQGPNLHKGPDTGRHGAPQHVGPYDPGPYRGPGGQQANGNGTGNGQGWPVGNGAGNGSGNPGGHGPGGSEPVDPWAPPKDQRS